MRRWLGLVVVVLGTAGAGVAQTTPDPTATPTPSRHLTLDLERLASTTVLGAGTDPESSGARQSDVRRGFRLPPTLWPAAGTLAAMRDARLATWDSPVGRLEYSVRQSLGAPGLFKQPRGVVLPPPVSIERGSDGKLHLVFPGLGSQRWRELSDDEKFAVIAQELVSLWLFGGLLGHR